jgi:hypothetical protein
MPIFLAIALMLSMAAFAPYASKPSDPLLRPRRTPTPLPTPTVAPVGLTAPTLLTPADGVTLHPGEVTWSWTAVPGAARYHIQAGNGTAFNSQYNIIEYWGLTTPSYTFNVSSGFIVYFPYLYWRVQAIDANNVQGPWSEVRVIHFVSP